MRGPGDRGDALLELGDLAGQRRLVADPRRQPAEQPRHLAARLDEAIDIVDQQQHVLVRRVAEMLGDGERRQAGPPARAGRLVHLAEDERGAFEHAGLPEFEQQLVPLARALADAGEHRDAGMALDRGADQLHDEHGLADPGAAEHRGLAAGDERREQIDHLDPGMENLARAALAIERRCRRMDRPAFDVRRQRRTTIHGLADRVEQPPEHRVADRRADRCPEGARSGATPQPGCAVQSHGAHGYEVKMLLNFSYQRTALIAFNFDALINGRQNSGGKTHIDNRAMDGSEPT